MSTLASLNVNSPPNLTFHGKNISTLASSNKKSSPGLSYLRSDTDMMLTTTECSTWRHYNCLKYQSIKSSLHHTLNSSLQAKFPYSHTLYPTRQRTTLCSISPPSTHTMHHISSLTYKTYLAFYSFHVISPTSLLYPKPLPMTTSIAATYAVMLICKPLFITIRYFVQPTENASLNLTLALLYGCRAWSHQQQEQ